ncbi:pentapeptide repeat-containing protein [Kordiimonas aestuarii]|uniref:pentapeptide repeat-containing protein n=1 Tax=Kordiimonas aestuarii TaxID=1005925 RepID=UPI0021CE9874|nr:pentapeptide repeat-containing protein [Kordiimonas aestuarii]
MDLKTLTNMFPSHKLVMGEQFAQENISALKVKSVLRWSDTIFVNCDFSEAQFHLLILSGAIFFKCDFSGARFTACDVDGCEFITSNLTCTLFDGSSVTDTSFTDCIIGGMAGPQDFQSCSFYGVRYSRHIPIVSNTPYYVITTPEQPIYVFCTPNAWRLHGKGVRMTVEPNEVIGLEEPYKAVVRYVLEIEQSVGRRAVAGFWAHDPSPEQQKTTVTEAP